MYSFKTHPLLILIQKVWDLGGKVEFLLKFFLNYVFLSRNFYDVGGSGTLLSGHLTCEHCVLRHWFHTWLHSGVRGKFENILMSGLITASLGTEI